MGAQTLIGQDTKGQPSVRSEAWSETPEASQALQGQTSYQAVMINTDFSPWQNLGSPDRQGSGHA